MKTFKHEDREEKMAEAREEVRKWSGIFPGYASLVAEIKEVLHHRTQRGAADYAMPRFPQGGRR